MTVASHFENEQVRFFGQIFHRFITNGEILGLWQKFIAYVDVGVFGALLKNVEKQWIDDNTSHFFKGSLQYIDFEKILSWFILAYHVTNHKYSA